MNEAMAGACSNSNFPTLKKAKNAKKAKCDGRTDTVTYRSRSPRQKTGKILVTQTSGLKPQNDKRP